MKAKKPIDKKIEQAKKNNNDYNEYMNTIDIEYFINNKRAM